MLNWIFLVVAFGISGGTSSTGTVIVAAPDAVSDAVSDVVEAAQSGDSDKDNVAQMETSDDSGGFGVDEEAEAAPEYVAESQVSTGKFTTATEVKPILTSTKSSWVAIREYDGQDLLYFTQLMSWRCGLVAVRYSVNGGPAQNWPLPACHADTGWANAITPEDGLVYGTYALGSLQSVDIEVIYDDLSTDTASFTRNEILMP
ncbi:MAG: hypothetical protein Q9M48_04605 [Rhodobacterales bacterium]|nr:hypothetical protein [Rhodobacterales bacterium]